METAYNWPPNHACLNSYCKAAYLRQDMGVLNDGKKRWIIR